MLSVNAEPFSPKPGMTVSDLLAARFPDWRSVVVKVDGALVPRSDYARTTLHADARVEVIRLVSGG